MRSIFFTLRFVLFFVITGATFTASAGKARTTVNVKTAGHTGSAIANESVGPLGHTTLRDLQRSCGTEADIRSFEGSCVSMVIPGVVKVRPILSEPSARQIALGFDQAFVFIHQDEPFAGNESERFSLRQRKLAARGIRIEPNWADARPASTTVETPDDPLFGQQSNLELINKDPLWARAASATATAGHVCLVVMDTGVDASQADLAGRIDLGLSRSFVGSDAVSDPLFPHGTAVSGVAAAIRNNGLGIAGLAEAPVISFQVLQAVLPPTGSQVAVSWQSTTEGFLKAIYSVADLPCDLKVVNMSFVMSPDENARAAMEVQKDVLWVAAAGNNGPGSITYPAVYAQGMQNGITVGASADQFGRFAYYSGREANLLAPGDALTIWKNGYAVESGTSIAAPQVSAVAVVLASLHPEADPAKIRQALLAVGYNPALPGFGYAFVDGVPMLNAGAALRFLESANPAAITALQAESIAGFGSPLGSAALGDIAVIRGHNFCESKIVAPDWSRLPRTLCGVQALWNKVSVPLPLFMVSPEEIWVVVPLDLFQAVPTNTYQVLVTRTTETGKVEQSNALPVTVTAVAPYIHRDVNGLPLLFDGLSNRPTVAAPGKLVSLLASGLGLVVPATGTGAVGTGQEKVSAPVYVYPTDNPGKQFPVMATSDLQYAGFYRILIAIPSDEPVPASVTITVGGAPIFSVSLPR